MLLAGLIVAVSLASYGLGRISVALPAGGSTASQGAAPAAVSASRIAPAESAKTEDIPAPEGGYVASKNGTKYHLPWCGSAKQIKEENKIWFATKADAERAGYTAASNCPGI